MKTNIRLIALIGLVAMFGLVVNAQTRPRRAKTGTTNTDGTTKPKTDDSLLTVVPTDKEGQPTTGPGSRSRTANSSTTPRTNTQPATTDKPILTTKASPNTPTQPSQPAGPDLKHAISLFEQKQFAEALKEAKSIIASDATVSDAWKLAGLSELNLKKYPDSITDLEKARSLQKTEGAENKETNEGLAKAYSLTEQYDKALPLLTAATTKPGATPDAYLLQLRGVAEIKTGKTDAAAATFAEALKANPADTVSLFYLGKMAFDKKDFSGAIANFNRVTVANSSDASAWKYLAFAYIQRGFADAPDQAKSDADFAGAVHASEGLLKVSQDDDAQTLRGQTLYYAKQYPQAIVSLEKVSLNPNVKGEILLLLGQAYLQTKNNPKMISTLEKAAVKLPNNANVFRYLGYGYEVDKQYAKALTAYQKASLLAPNDTALKESVERVKPFAK